MKAIRLMSAYSQQPGGRRETEETHGSVELRVVGGLRLLSRLRGVGGLLGLLGLLLTLLLERLELAVRVKRL